MLKLSILQSLQAWRELIPGNFSLLIGYSGGLDSHVLLHSVCRIREQLEHDISAVHVNHNIHADSEDWTQHCMTVCKNLDINLHCSYVDASSPLELSPEERARQRRYDAIHTIMDTNDLLLTAHHLDDQLETFLLQLFRGTGMAGAAAMPQIQRIKTGWHGRPLLNFTRDELYRYAVEEKLDWIEDDSNKDTRFDRNYIRHEIMPVVKKRWGSVEKPLTRFISHAAAACEIMNELAETDLACCHFQGNHKLLDIRLMKTLSRERQRNLLRKWFEKLQLTTPASKHMDEIFHTLVDTFDDTAGHVSWKGGNVYRYRCCLFASREGFDVDTSALSCKWPIDFPLQTALGELYAVTACGTGIAKRYCDGQQIRVSYYSGGERMQPMGRRHHSPLKKLFQEQGVPPWQRQVIPLVYIGEQLAVVPGLWTADEFGAGANESSWDICWSGIGSLVYIKP